MLVSCVIRTLEDKVANAQLVDVAQSLEVLRSDDGAYNWRQSLHTVDGIDVIHGLCKMGRRACSFPTEYLLVFHEHVYLIGCCGQIDVRHCSLSAQTHSMWK